MYEGGNLSAGFCVPNIEWWFLHVLHFRMNARWLVDTPKSLPGEFEVIKTGT
jgi:hypothetical protein